MNKVYLLCVLFAYFALNRNSNRKVPKDRKEDAKKDGVDSLEELV